MPKVPTTTQSTFASLGEFFRDEDNLITVSELARISPFSTTQLRFWLLESEQNGLENAVIRPNSRRLYLHAGRFRQWLDERTKQMRQAKRMSFDDV